MTDFELRGTFYLGDSTDRDLMEGQCDRLMEHLLRVEARDGLVRDPSIGLDMSSRTVEVELVVTAETMLEAHQLASAAVDGAFKEDGDPVETAMELVTA